jgi:hypothetical protein
MTNEEYTLYAEPAADMVISSRKLKKGIYYPVTTGLFCITDLGDLIWRISKRMDSNSKIEIINQPFLLFGSAVIWQISIINKYCNIKIESKVYNSISLKGGADPKNRALIISIKGDKKKITQIISEVNKLSLKPPYEFSNWKKFTNKYGVSKEEVIQGWKQLIDIN